MKNFKSLLSPVAATFVAVFVSMCLFTVGCTDETPQGPICDPFAEAAIDTSTGTTSSTSGVKATLYRLQRDIPKTMSVIQAQSQGTKIDLEVYLTQLFVPLHRFDTGFTAANGVPLRNPDGSLFSEWFSLHLEGFLTLGRDQLPGDYQFALFSDDGSVLKMDTGAGFKTIVDNDYSHDAILQVATQPVKFELGQRIAYTIDYMQGSPDYLSAILLMRPWPTGDDRPVMDPAAGVNTPSAFWNSSTMPSTPGPAWNELLSRGWKVVTPESFDLSSENPCNKQAQ